MTTTSRSEGSSARNSRPERGVVGASTALVAAVERALRAPSVHNTQPGLWRIGDSSVDLYADWRRHLISTDPDRRDLLLSCRVPKISGTWQRSPSMTVGEAPCTRSCRLPSSIAAPIAGE